MTLAPGTLVDRYTLVSPLGEGGQGAVWKATDPLTPGEPRALKLVRLPMSRPADAERTRREARALARLDHPSLVRCHALFEDLKLEILGLSLDFVDGTTLGQARADARFTPRHAGLALAHVASALGYVHGVGVAHRDIKLSNVVVTREFWDLPELPSSVKLLDFGIAAVAGASREDKLTALGAVIGTPAYLAPELLDPTFFALDRLADPGFAELARADVFAFGVLAYRLLTGAHPTGLDPHATVMDFGSEYRARATASDAWPQRLPDEPWGSLVQRCLALRAADRIADGSALAALAARAAGRPEPATIVDRAAAPAPAAATLEVATRADVVRAPAEEPSSGGSGLLLGALGLFAVVSVGALVASRAGDPEHVAPQGSQSAGPIKVAPRVVRTAPSSRPAPSATAPSPSTVAPAPPSASAAASGAPSVSAAPSAAPALLGPYPAECTDVDEPCDCCRTGRTCGEQGCAASFDPAEAVSLRPMRLARGAADAWEAHDSWSVCLRLSGSAEPWVCTTGAEARDDHAPGKHVLGTLGELTTHGIDAELRDGARVIASAAKLAPAAPLTRLALCHGLDLPALPAAFGADTLVLYLDPAGGETPSRCR